jgi:hypothetical protein
MRRFLRWIWLRRGILYALAETERHGALCEEHAAAFLADYREQRCGGTPVFGALLFAGQAGHVHGGVAQRHERLPLTWHWYRREKF